MTQTTTTTTLRDVLPPDWVWRIRHHFADDAAEGSPAHGATADAVLTMAATDHCAVEVRRICALADFVVLQWPDVDDSVVELALRQVSVVCFG